MGIWAIWSPLKIHCYTCMSFKTCWSRLIYTKLSSHRSFVINMYVVTMAWRCISPWSFHRSPQRRREMDIFRYISRFPRILGENNQKEEEKPREGRHRNLSAAVLHVKPSRHNSNLYDSRENHHKVEILNYSVSLQYCKRNRDFITINFQKFSFFQGVFHVLERFIGLEPWDLLPLTIKCYRNFLQNYKGTIFGVAWTEKYRFEIIDAVTDESKGTIFDNLYRPTFLDRTISFFFLVSRPPQGKIKDETFDFLSCKSLRDCVLFIFFKLGKDIREKSMENNGDKIAVLLWLWFH